MASDQSRHFSFLGEGTPGSQELKEPSGNIKYEELLLIQGFIINICEIYGIIVWVTNA